MCVVIVFSTTYIRTRLSLKFDLAFDYQMIENAGNDPKIIIKFSKMKIFPNNKVNANHRKG